MMSWRTSLRCTAFILLLAAAFDIFVVDFALAGSCDEAASQNGTKPYPDDDCFCCCAHIVLTKPAHVEPLQVYSVAESIVSILTTDSEPDGIYHPPRI